MNKFTNNFTLCLDARRNWKSREINDRNISVFGFVDGLKDEEFLQKLSTASAAQIQNILVLWTGHFMFTIEDPEFVLAATDPSGACQLLWAENKGNLIIADNINSLMSYLKLSEHDIDKDMALSVAMSGYTIGNSTLYKPVKLLGAGQYLIAEKARIRVSNYYKWVPKQNEPISRNSIDELIHLNNKVIEKLIKRADGQKIIVPLSAGWDSRFVASGLADQNYDNVLCVSYGRPRNRETNVAQQVASTLGFRHIEFKYTNKLIRSICQTEEYSVYKKFCDTGTGVHFFGEYPMLKLLSQKGELDNTTIFANGQSGDFISGNHIPSCFADTESLEDEVGVRLDTILDALTDKHYALWKTLCTEQNLTSIKVSLKDQLNSLGGLPSLQSNDYGIFEAIEFYNRQSKYVLNGLRTYEFFGHEWSIPLWDKEYMDFWRRVSLAEKKQQILYKETLLKQNWGKTWLDVEINPSIPIPLPLNSARFFLKALFLFFGKDKWHDFERRYLDIFMTNTHGYAFKTKMEVWLDRRQHRNPLSYIVEEYLNDKSIRWDGQPLPKPSTSE